MLVSFAKRMVIAVASIAAIMGAISVALVAQGRMTWQVESLSSEQGSILGTFIRLLRLEPQRKRSYLFVGKRVWGSRDSFCRDHD